MAIANPDEEERIAVSEWLTANGIEPKSVPRYDSGLRIEHHDGQRSIHYTGYVLSDTGRIQVDPEDPTTEWTHQTSSPLRVAPPVWLGIPGA